MIGLIQPALWVVTGGFALAFALMALRARCKSTGARTPRTPLLISLGSVAAALLVVPSIGIIPAGHRGVIYEWGGGVNPKERGEGFTLLAPWIQTIRNISVRTQKVFSSKVYAQSLDLQED